MGRARLAEAVALRARILPGAHRRLVHAEADRLPGLIIDRFGDVAVLQANTAGMNRLLPDIAAPLVPPGGFLFVASCSHHAPLDLFSGQVTGALLRAKREARTIHTGGAGPDHPVHPHLPESACLKFLLQLTQPAGRP